MLRFLAVLVFLSLPAGPALAFGNCLDPGYLDNFRRGLAPEPCDEDYYITINAASGSALLRVIRLRSEPDSLPTEAWRPEVERAARGIGRAMDTLGAGRLPAEITVLMTSGAERTEELDEVHADTTRIGGGECRVVFYKLQDGAAPAEFVHSLAHEVFHCVQFNSWLAAARVSEAGWWVEGSAEYFAHLAIRDPSVGQPFIDDFDTLSLTTSLTDMEYETVVFFAWLGQSGGPEAVGRFLGQMRPGDQQAVLRSLLAEGDWTRFVEDWLDGEVSLPGGREVRPGPMATGEQVFARSAEITLRAGAFVIDRWGAAFPEGKQFQLTHSAGTGVLAMKVLGSSDPWAPPPETISTCDGEKRHILYLTTTGAATEGRLTVETDEDDTGAACCLIGTWSPTAETLAGHAQFGMDVGAMLIAGRGAEMSCAPAGGGWTLSFAGDRTGALIFDANATECTVRADGGAMVVASSRSGTTAFDWSLLGPGGAALRYTGYDVTYLTTLQIGPMTQVIDMPDDGPSGLPSGMAFSCSEDTLKVKGLYGLSHYEATHTRVPAP